MSTTDMDTPKLPVFIEKFEPTSPTSPSLHGGKRKRLPIATEHFPAGATANDVCEQVMKKYGADMAMGIWLLQVKVEDTDQQETGETEGGYITIKDSKYELKEGQDYFVIHFSGSGMFLYS